MKYPSVMLIAIVVLLVFGMKSSSTVPSLSQYADEEARSTLVLTFRLVHEANTMGANKAELSDLVEKLNQALHLIDESVRLEGRGETSKASNLIHEAMEILTTVQSEARLLETRAAQRSSRNRVNAYVVALVLATLTVLVFHGAKQAYRRYQTARTMNMIITVRSDA